MQFVRNLRQLHELGRVVHVAGGEAMMFWDDLRAGWAAAQAAGVSPHFVETNCSFATDDVVTRKRLEELRALGVAGLLASTNPYHQTQVPPENFLRVRRLACEIFGAPNFWSSTVPDEQIRQHAVTARDPAQLREHARQNPPVLVSTAFRALAEFFEECPLDELPLAGGWVWKQDYVAPDCRVDWARENVGDPH